MNSQGGVVSSETVSKCPVCSNSERSRIAAGFDYEYETCCNEWYFWQCATCGHLWLDPRPTRAALGTIYPRNYYSYDYEKRINALAVRAKEWLDRRKFSYLTSLFGKPLRTYLDVGCGSGRFLKLAEKLGIDRQEAVGIELSRDAVEELAEQGFAVECNPIEDAAIVRERTFDLITMFHVIEHVADPRQEVRILANALSEGGVLALETPNFESLDARMFRRRFWGGYHFPRHWHIFTLGSITRTLAEAGLEVVAVRYQTGHSFWLFSFHHALKFGRFRARRLASLVHPLRSLPALVLVTAFDLLRSVLGFKTSAMLVVAKRPRGPI